MGPETLIHGTVAPGFEPVEAVFRENFASRREVGAATCAFLDGEKVVDLWGGLADRAQQRPWQQDTITVIFSGTKGLTATCFLLLADRGKLDYDLPVAHYWPEFAARGKQAITVRQLLNHRSGLTAIEQPLTLDDFAFPDRVARAIAAQAPIYPPGVRQAYGPIAWGPFAAELFRRIEGRTLGRFLQEEVAAPLGADVFLGLPEALDQRAATLYPVGASEALKQVLPTVLFRRTAEGRMFRRAFLSPGSPSSRAMFSRPRFGKAGLGCLNDPRVRRLELPWCNALASAEGLATVYAPLAQRGRHNGTSLVRPETLVPVQVRQSWGEPDVVLQKPQGFSQGYVKDELHLVSPSLETFGHTGMGGSVGFADPSRGLAFAYVMNRMDHRIRSPRCLALCHALYRCLDAADLRRGAPRDTVSAHPERRV